MLSLGSREACWSSQVGPQREYVGLPDMRIRVQEEHFRLHGGQLGRRDPVWTAGAFHHASALRWDLTGPGTCCGQTGFRYEHLCGGFSRTTYKLAAHGQV